MRQHEKSQIGGSSLVRLSVVLDSDLAEHVRTRAFETRTSKSAYVRGLVARDAKLSAQQRPADGTA